MSRNPEFRRNLVLELTRYRLAAMPCVLLLTMLLAYAIATEPGKLYAAGWTAFALFTAVTLFWGTQLSVASITDEFRDKTWDQQRLSALDPWTLTWGKLLGAPVFAWYGGAFCMPVFIAGMQHEPDGPPALALTALMLGTTLLMHALGLLSALMAPRNGRRSSVTLIALLFLLMAGGPLVTGLMKSDPISWWGFQWNAMWFSVASSWIFAAWAVIGVYRVLGTELQVRTMPVVWLSLAAFLSFYLTGFSVGHAANTSVPTLFAMFGFGVTLTMTYLSVWIEKRDVISVHRLVLRFKADLFRRAAEETPCWLATAPFALLFALFLLARSDITALEMLTDRDFAALPLTLLMLALRDIALLYFFSFSDKRRNVEVAVIVYLGMLYWLIPALLSVMGLGLVANLILPPLLSNPTLALVVAALQAGIAAWLAIARWRKRLGAIAPPAPG